MFEREIVKVLVKRISEPRHFIQILKGPRQTGKTTALLQLEQKISIPVLSVEASIDAASRDWVRAKWVLAREAAKESAEALLIIDEIQLVPQWSSVVKQLWDEDTRNKTNLKVKF